jgi:hypothetical protein
VAIVWVIRSRKSRNDGQYKIKEWHTIQWPQDTKGVVRSRKSIVLSVLPRFTTSDYSFGIMWPFYCLSFLELQLLITLLVSCGHCIVCRSWIYDLWLPIWYLVAIVLYVLPENTMASRYQRGNQKSLIEEGQTIEEGKTIQWPQDTKGIRFTISDYPFGILWPLHCLSFLDLRLLITPLVSCSHRIVGPYSI